MLLCSKCQQNPATVHITTVMGSEVEKLDFCKDCAPATGYEGLTPARITALSVTGKKCEFCGKEAISGVMYANGTIYWCYDCGLERGGRQPESESGAQREKQARAASAIIADCWSAESNFDPVR